MSAHERFTRMQDAARDWRRAGFPSMAVWCDLEADYWWNRIDPNLWYYYP